MEMLEDIHSRGETSTSVNRHASETEDVVRRAFTLDDT